MKAIAFAVTTATVALTDVTVILVLLALGLILAAGWQFSQARALVHELDRTLDALVDKVTDSPQDEA